MLLSLHRNEITELVTEDEDYLTLQEPVKVFGVSPEIWLAAVGAEVEAIMQAAVKRCVENYRDPKVSCPSWESLACPGC